MIYRLVKILINKFESWSIDKQLISIIIAILYFGYISFTDGCRPNGGGPRTSFIKLIESCRNSFNSKYIYLKINKDGKTENLLVEKNRIDSLLLKYELTKEDSQIVIAYLNSEEGIKFLSTFRDTLDIMESRKDSNYMVFLNLHRYWYHLKSDSSYLDVGKDGKQIKNDSVNVSY